VEKHIVTALFVQSALLLIFTELINSVLIEESRLHFNAVI